MNIKNIEKAFPIFDKNGNMVYYDHDESGYSRQASIDQFIRDTGFDFKKEGYQCYPVKIIFEPI